MIMKKSDMQKQKIKMQKGKVKIAKGVMVSKATAAKMKKAPGGSNVGKYKNVKPSDMALKGKYPINTEKRARAALSYAHNATPSEQATIKRKVKQKYPSIKVKGLKNKKK
jgi:hypothetical protein